MPGVDTTQLFAPCPNEPDESEPEEEPEPEELLEPELLPEPLELAPELEPALNDLPVGHALHDSAVASETCPGGHEMQRDFPPPE